MLTESVESKYLSRIQDALDAASAALVEFLPGGFEIQDRGGRDVVTAVDRKISDVLRKVLLRPGEGWLSEEDADDRTRLSREVVWIVDPLDGTREFVDAIPEWCISIGLTISGVAVAGGIFNPATGERFLGSMECGVTYNGCQVVPVRKTSLHGAVVLASRQECARGEWARFEGKPFSIQPMGSVAYKLALVSAGLADATWTLSPKNEWDVAAGVALANSSGCAVCCTQSAKLLFNQDKTLLPGLVASGKDIWDEVLQVVSPADII
jgi:myo-inositol-1(or 4)-monophosphatase